MCFSLPALLAVTLSSAPGPAREMATASSAVEPPRALTSELGTAVGLFTGGYGFEGGRWEDAYLANTTSARFLLGGFTLDGGLLSLLPLERGGPGGSTSVTARLGYTSERWSVVGGAVVGLGYTSQPLLQVLPSVKGLYRVGPVDLEAGIFDANGQVPAHLGASYGPVGLAYVFPLGGRARVDIPLAARAGVRLEGFVFQYGDVRTSLVTVGVVGRPTASAHAGGAS
ncbi:hypothetical protein JY651_44925 [Pyxidicoccus parkwayensis]|uniref:Outer membrane protein beta-barrel domain-containing protein n=1 Tax=Pyxidicoccus parkwayensis TaxID=2813578 RepID=A0ABX7NTH8_9BACT|nr:hypothetical protein [Pyxidicoccus parkwaysis]QSQ22199.1 hypothetical protein JY651_44925 [Pyxidicoccus parkwaysis]